MGAREVLNVLVIIFCTVAITLSIYDLTRLNTIHNRAITKCNDFYHKEFAARCPSLITSPQQPIYNTNFSMEFRT